MSVLVCHFYAYFLLKKSYYQKNNILNKNVWSVFLLEYLINLNDSLLIKNPELCFLYKAHMYPSDNVDGVSNQHLYEVRKVRCVEILQPAASFCWISWSSNSFRPIHPWSAVHSPASCCLLPAASRLQLKSSTASAVSCPAQSLEGIVLSPLRRLFHLLTDLLQR